MGMKMRRRAFSALLSLSLVLSALMPGQPLSAAEAVSGNDVVLERVSVSGNDVSDAQKDVSVTGGDIPVTAAGDLVNVALGKTVTAGTDMGEADADALALVTDGKIEKGWEKSFGYHTGEEAENTQIKPYVQIDLGEIYEVESIKYFGLIPPDYPDYKNTSYNMVIQLSEDEEFAADSTVTVFNSDRGNFFGYGEGTDEDQASSMDGRLITFAKTQARYVRYYQHGARQSDHQPPRPGWVNALALCELEVYAQAEPVEPPAADLIPDGNLAYQAKVTGSEFNSSGAAVSDWWGGWGNDDLQEITNGSANSDHWKAPRTNSGGDTGECAYLLIDMNRVQKINTVKLWSKIGMTYPGQIVQISENGRDWINVYNSDQDNKAGQDPDNSGQEVCGGKLANGTITGVKAGTNEAYQETAEGKTIAFDTASARYIRWWCSGNSAGNELPQMIQLQAYCNVKITYDFNDAYEGNEGSEPLVHYVNQGDTAPRPSAPVYPIPGWLFDKWTVDTAGGAEWDFSRPVMEELTLTASWKKAAVHTVTFDSKGGTRIDPVKVTDTLAVARPENPEKDGYVFAGWKYNGAPYDFSAPVVEDILLSAAWAEPAVPNAFVIHAGLLDMVLDSHGQVTNLLSTLDGRDYAAPGPDGKLRSLVSLVADYRMETPTSLEWDETRKELTFGFASIDAKAVVALSDEGDYTSLTLTAVEHPESISIQAILWGPVKTSITTGGQSVGTVYDDEYAIGMHMLNTKTVGGWPIEYKDSFYAPDLPAVNGYPDPRVTRNIYSNTAAFSTWGSALQGYTWDYTEDTMRTVAYFSEVPQLQPAMTGPFAAEDASMIGSSIALYGTRRDNILNVISNIQLTEGLPHPTIDGEWQKTSVKTGQDFLVFNDSMWGLDVVENDAKMANAAGINYIYGQYGASGPWNGDGSYEFNGYFGGSDENAKKMAEKAAEYNVYIGTHTLSNLISWGTKYMTPEASPALSYAGFSGLTREAAAADTTLYVQDGFPFSATVVGASGGGRLVRIDKELVTYTDCSQVSEKEWKLTGCTRGVNGTTASPYAAGEKAYKLWSYYTCPALGGWDSIEPVTSRMGYVYSDLGIHCMSYDSFESTKYSVYSSLLPARYMKSVYQKVKDAGRADGFLTEASDMDTNVWDVHSRISWGESNTPIDAMMNYMNYYRQNFFPAMLGWMYDHGGHGGYGKSTLLMNLSMKGGWNAGAGWYVNRNTFNQYPYMADMLKTWNNAIQRGAFALGGEFTEELQGQMRNAWKNGKVWTLTEVKADEEWVLQEVQKSNVDTAIGEPVTLYAARDIKITQPEGGDIATDTSLEYSRAHAGETVTVYVQPHTGMHMTEGSLKVTAADNTECAITAVEGEEGAYTFTMPDQEIAITALFTGEEAQESAEKQLLRKTVEYARGLDTTGVVESAVTFFEKALKNAEKILTDPNAPGDQVTAAWEELVKGIHGLGLIKGDKTALGILIEKADSMIANADKYVAKNWKKLMDALDAAKAVMEDEDAMAGDIMPSQEELLNAILAQRFKADKKNLEELIKKAQAVDESLYTEDSLQLFRSAFAKAAAIMEDENLSEDDQALVDQGEKELRSAMDQLEKKQESTEPTEPSEPADPSEPEDNQPSDNGDDGQGSAQETGGDADDTQNGEVKAPKTGDGAPLGMIAAAAGAGILCVLAVTRKKKES